MPEPMTHQQANAVACEKLGIPRERNNWKIDPDNHDQMLRCDGDYPDIATDPATAVLACEKLSTNRVDVIVGFGKGEVCVDDSDEIVENNYRTFPAAVWAYTKARLGIVEVEQWA